MIGQLLTGRYLILEKLGTGGFSETYLARDKYLPRHPFCVVKRLKLPAHSTIQLETAQRLFETEALLLGQLGRDHPQIPTLFAYSQEQDSTYLVQEYIEGENLRVWLSPNRRFTAKAAIALLRELLPVLDYIHTRQVVHCDITPSNLIRRPDGKIVLIDFGAAYPGAETRPSDAEALLLEIGTPGYIPDEQRLGMPRINSDLYALGILVIHLLTKADPRQFKQDVISGELDWQRYLEPASIPSNLVAILSRMVRSHVSDRYQQTSEVLTDLQSLQNTPPNLNHWSSWAQKMILPTSTALLVGTALTQMPTLKRNYGQAKATIVALEHQFAPEPAQALTMLREIPMKPGIDRLLITPNKRVMVSVGTDRRMRLWSLPGGKPIATLTSNSAPITTLAVSSNSKFLVSGHEDGKLQLWDIQSGQLRQQFAGHEKAVIAIAISPDLQSLTSSSKDRTIRQWNLQTGTMLKMLKFPAADTTAITYPAADHLITASRDHQLQVWNLRSGQIERTFSGHTDEIVDLRMINDHTLISFGKDRGLMWDLNRERLTQVLPSASADTVLVSNGDRTLMTVHRNGHIRTWISQNGKLVMRERGKLDNPKNIALSPTHDYLVSWNANQRLRFWQIR